MPILQNGSYSAIDSDGYIVNYSNIQQLPQKWQSALDVIIKEYIQNLGEQNIESIVVRGSVARGEPVDNISDIDTIAIVRQPDPDTSWIKSSIEKLQKQYPYIAGFELVLWNSEKVKNPESKNMRFMLKFRQLRYGVRTLLETLKMLSQMLTCLEAFCDRSLNHLTKHINA